MIRRRLGLLFFLTAACSRAAPASPDPPRSNDAGPPIASVAIIQTPDAPDAPPTYMGRTIAAPMSWQGADWLDRADRNSVQRPEHVLDVLGVHEGQTVADVGCGSGYFTVHLARRVGPRGRVIATDLQQEMLDLLKKKLDTAKIGNVTSRLTTPKDAKLEAGELDLVLLVDVYHEVASPPTTLAQIRRALAKDGRLALVEYRAEDPKVAIKPEHKTTLVQLQRELGANGFVFVSSDESLPEQRVVVFKAAP
jgi:ubiquinone/menaquinone biosynthesis C-methylase UbiE